MGEFWQNKGYFATFNGLCVGQVLLTNTSTCNPSLHMCTLILLKWGVLDLLTNQWRRTLRSFLLLRHRTYQQEPSIVGLLEKL